MDNEAKINIGFLIIFLGLLLVLMIYPIIAIGYEVNNNEKVILNITASGTGVYGVTSGNQTINEDTEYTFNFTINHINSSNFNLTRVNITIPGNFTLTTASNKAANISAVDEGWNLIAFSNLSFGINETILTFNGSNASSTVIFSRNSTSPGKNNTFLSVNLTAGTPGKYNITIAFQFNGSLVNMTNLSIIVNDTTRPYQVNISNITLNHTRSYANISGTLTINFSALDNGNLTAGAREYDVNAINVSFFNGSDYNASYLATNGSSAVWGVTITSSTLTDGVYNITIAVNDTLNNVNRTNLTNVRIDNTKPTGSASCTPTTVNAGNTVTCTCSVSDSTSGVNSSATSITAKPSTSNTGTFTETCTFADMAGNTASAATTYTVELGTSSGGGGGGGSSSGSKSGETFYTRNIDVVGKDFKEIETITQKVGEKERVRVKLDNEVHYVGVRDVTLTSAFIEVASDPVQFELNAGEEKKVEVTGDNFYDVYVKLNAIVNGKADLVIKYINEEFTPTEEVEEAPTQEEEEGAVTEKETKETEKTAVLVWVLIILVIIVIIGVVYWLYKRKR